MCHLKAKKKGKSLAVCNCKTSSILILFSPFISFANTSKNASGWMIELKTLTLCMNKYL